MIALKQPKLIPMALDESNPLVLFLLCPSGTKQDLTPSSSIQDPCCLAKTFHTTMSLEGESVI